MEKSIKALLQIGYWLLYFMLLTVLFFLLTFFQKPPLSFVAWCRIMAGFAVIPGVISFYSFYTLLFSRYRREGSLFRLLSFSLLVSVLAAGAGMVALTLLVSPKFLVNDGFLGVFVVGVPLTFIAFVNGSIAFVIKGFISWFEDIQLREELNQRNYEMELALVKSQIDPHFLFNTINNIDILIEKESTRASAYLNKLSDIMRFMLYETKTSEILLERELAYIEQYVALQRIRTSNPNAIICAWQGNPGPKMIAPMLFIPFIENAFKHANLKNDRAVCVNLDIGEHIISFECENLIGPNEQTDKRPGGLGKNLIERRLSLLYPGKHELITTFDTHKYHVKLTIRE